MHDPPVSAIAIIRSPKGPNCFAAILPNGKSILAHLPKALAGLAQDLRPDTQVTVELTPFDFDHARICGLHPPGTKPAQPPDKK